MLRSLDHLRNYRIAATDGELGSVFDVLFDDHQWIVRYFVVDTGKWLPGKLVLVPPYAIQEADWVKQHVKVSLSRDQLREGLELNQDEPVSRQLEVRIPTQMAWPYWGPQYIPARAEAAAVAEAVTQTRDEAADKPKGDPHLRSVSEVTGYAIEASDGSVGHVEDFVAEDSTWNIHYMVVDTRNWLPGKKVLISPDWLRDVNWVQRKVVVDLGCEEIKNSPNYDPAAPINMKYEEQLYDYYGRPKQRLAETTH